MSSISPNNNVNKPATGPEVSFNVPGVSGGESTNADVSLNNDFAALQALRSQLRLQQGPAMDSTHQFTEQADEAKGTSSRAMNESVEATNEASEQNSTGMQSDFDAYSLMREADVLKKRAEYNPRQAAALKFEAKRKEEEALRKWNEAKEAFQKAQEELARASTGYQEAGDIKIASSQLENKSNGSNLEVENLNRSLSDVDVTINNRTEQNS